MIIPMDNFRLPAQHYCDDSLDYRHVRGNALPVRKYASRDAASPVLPDNFNDFNAKEFIDRAYALATQI